MNLRIFLLVRTNDVTGVSGNGIVAAGMEFPDGHVVMRWLVGEHRSSVTWDSMESLEKIHGHGGATRVVWLADVSRRRPDNRFGVDVRLVGPGVYGMFIPACWDRPEVRTISSYQLSFTAEDLLP